VPALLTMSGQAWREHIAAVVETVIARRAFFLVDPPAGAATAEAVLKETDAIAEIVDRNGALYWPPLVAADGSTVAPSVAVAGVIAQIDAARGVWKAPAGIEASLDGLTPAVLVDTNASSTLNDHSVNVIRKMPQYGTVVWGARTLSRDPEFRYVPVRRTLLFVESSLEQGLQWAAIEPNGPALWSAVRRSIENFLFDLWRSGAFMGVKPEEAFFVRCDATTMTQDDLDNGRLNVLVGVAPARPAEFVILDISQITARP
jgi:phage tail sheath protein FI